MLYWLPSLEGVWGPLRLFEYVTFRAGGAALTAFLVTIFLGSYMAKWLKVFHAQAPCRYKGIVDEKFIDHSKDKTPSMGGILILLAVAVAMLLWNKLFSDVSWVLLFSFLLFGLLGFLDDYVKVAYQRRDGIPGKLKLIGQFCIAGAAIMALRFLPETHELMTQLMLPMFKEPVWVSPWVMLFSMVVVVGASNAVNLTDGKDGLAAGCVIFCAITYAAMTYLYGHALFAKYLHVPFIPGASEAVVFACAIVGACLGFLWHNCHPAAMFMGDTGSLALGGSIGLMAVIIRQEVLLVLVGGVFVIEALSVIMQVASFKLTGKRIFLCAPIHHHFERKNWTETQIVVRFWILAGIFALAALSTLKLR